MKIMQTVPEQHTGKTRNRGAIKYNHVGHCARTAESTNVKAPYMM
jgi:hypothetical protein